MAFEKIDARDEPRRGLFRERWLIGLEGRSTRGDEEGMRAVVGDILQEEFAEDVALLYERHPDLYAELKEVVESVQEH